MKAPHRGVMRLFHRKSVINSKNCFLNGFFARNSQNPGLNRQKLQNLRLFTNNGIYNKPRFFTLMSRVSDTNSTRWTINCQSGMAIDFMRIKKRWAVYFTRIKKTLSGICVCSFDVQNPRVPYQLPILYILYVWSPLKRRLVSFIKEIRKSRVSFLKEIR